NGSGEHHKVSKPVWQMIFFALGAGVLLLTMAWTLGPFVVVETHKELALPYYRWLMTAEIFFGLQAALAGFFTGTGRPKIVTYAAMIANTANVLLTILLVFGIEGWVPAMGTEGAALGTLAAAIIQVLFLGCLFLSPSNHQKYSSQIGRAHV